MDGAIIALIALAIGLIIVVVWAIVTTPRPVQIIGCSAGTAFENGKCQTILGGTCTTSSTCLSYLECLPMTGGNNQCRYSPGKTCPQNTSLSGGGCSSGYVCDEQCLPGPGGTCDINGLPCANNLKCSNGICRLPDGSICSSNDQCASNACYINQCRALSGSPCSSIILCLNGVSCIDGICHP